ncbi:MAG: PAS domain-containing sensor histidine kinase [Melioribacteraceae bacterium]|nr:PAS domain-containing sensor histidine kinase [Melioribacteraceae bacterium]
MKEFLNKNIDDREINLLDNFSFAFFRIDSSDNLIYANKYLLKLLDYISLDELISNINLNPSLKYCFSFRRLAKSESVENEFLWITKNNTKKIFKEIVQKVKDENNNEYIDCVIKDVTEKKFLENLIKDINSKEASILKAIPDYILVVSKNFEIIDTKNNVSKIFPDFVSIKGLHIKDLFDENISNKLEKIIKEVIETSEQINFEFEIFNFISTSYYEARIVQRNFEEVIFIIRDITREKVAEEQLKKFTEELKQLNATKDKFFSIIAHDLRTPLNGILNYAEILASEYNDLSKEEIKEFSEYILEISRSTNTLLNNLLEWARIQNGKINFEPALNNLYYTAEKVLDMLKIVASNKEVMILNMIDKDLEFVFDKNMLTSILLNLVNNAIKFSNPGGKIEILSYEFDNYYKISIKDEGVGMSEEISSKLFNSNFNVTSLGTAKEKGTGLGLVLCKEFVKKHKGNIWVESKLGEGSTFSFTISKEFMS